MTFCLSEPQAIDTLETFLEDAKRTHICFTHEYSITAESFLDVINKINNGIIATSLFPRKHRQPSLSPIHQLSSNTHEKFYYIFIASNI